MSRYSPLVFQNVVKSYPGPTGPRRPVLSDVSFDVPAGDKIAIVGRSGSGKTTLLHLAAGIDVPSSGEVFVDGLDIRKLSDRKRTLLRRKNIGLVFQFFYLLPHLSIRDNVALPGLIAGSPLRSVHDHSALLLDRVGLSDRADDTVEKLSGGEMQRVAICRALISRPRLVLADEPTGNLDDDTAKAVLDLILELVDEAGGSLILVTHSNEIARQADKRWRLHSGILETA